MSLSRTVRKWFADRVTYEIAKVNARARKIGAPEFSVEVAPAAPVPADGQDGVMEERVTITIAGEPVRVAGWSLLGRVDFEGGMVIASSRPGAELPARYRSATRDCEHCNVNRRRASVFVFEGVDGNAGRHIQVGRSCLKDFLGHDPEVVLWAANAWVDLGELVDEDAQGQGGHPAEFTVAPLRVLQAACSEVRRHGYVSSQAAEDRMIISTREAVFSGLLGESPTEWYRHNVSEEDVEKAAAIAGWVASEWGALVESQAANEYQHNAVQLVANDYISTRRIGIVVGLVAAYDRETASRAERARIVDAHVGTPGQRREFAATFVGESQYETAFGTTHIGRFATDEGLLVYRGTAPFWSASLGIGSRVKFVATIKEHGEYKGKRQTLIQRGVKFSVTDLPEQKPTES